MEGSINGPSKKRVAVVTGGNRGMGLEICRQLAAHGLTVVLTARDEKRGAEAAEKLREEGLSDVVFHQLEISEPASAAHLAAFIKDKFGKLDILVNNAGVLGVTTDVGDPATLQETLAGKDGMERAEWLRQRTTQTTQDAEDCLRINYHGSKIVTEALLPLLRSSSDGRIVNVTSAWGLLRSRTVPSHKTEAHLLCILQKCSISAATSSGGSWTTSTTSRGSGSTRCRGCSSRTWARAMARWSAAGGRPTRCTPPTWRPRRWCAPTPGSSPGRRAPRCGSTACTPATSSPG
ncbi:short-chain dehydrogenase/reductase 2b isoform X2 [Aegilops tauschii subsp. strangulata]|uniref:(+)-neomenthol dehydrogenase n=1 Tax=Aegilops tauschii subsp. strangulata TaxID=200361 RepID=A0A452ZYH9_AEGTS|nr:short-chain dehydrogenase/reductase 2b isoform X2 [Aegilops tauschii subsp. strangulata]